MRRPDTQASLFRGVDTKVSQGSNATILLQSRRGEAASENGITLNKDKVKEIVYGMPHSIWKEKYQKEATNEQQSNFTNEELKEN